MKKTVTAILLGILLVGTFGAAIVSAVASNDTKEKAVVSTVASDDAKAKGDLGQMHNLCGKYMNSGSMHNLCGKYMNSGTMHTGSMHNWCNKYMNSGTFNSNNSNVSVGQTYADSGNNQGGFSCH
ncbi:MAG: hypothetical protein EHM20_16595 [Alphaproteobacteria bacterium]|nr:MAG: hypothetical protein EHM20_16595 [Alphaproteobacteria bacterium]